MLKKRSGKVLDDIRLHRARAKMVRFHGCGFYSKPAIANYFDQKAVIVALADTVMPLQTAIILNFDSRLNFTV